MADHLDIQSRSQLMGRVRGKDTGPEMIVRRLVHGMGYRYRLHRRDLPGSPDLVFPSHRAVIFVHGCFWHRHKGCRKASTPKTRQDFWQQKFDRNVARDAAAEQQLRAAGWRVETIWECDTRDLITLRSQLEQFLSPP